MKFFTQRLVLRNINEYDAAGILKIRSDSSINQFLHRNPPKNTFEALDFILDIRKKEARKEILFLGICFKNNSELLGTLCFWNFSEDGKTAELGYELLPEFHGQGIMSEAAEFLVAYGFRDLTLNHIEAFTHKKNVSSIKLLENLNFILKEDRKDEKYPENLIFERSK